MIHNLNEQFRKEVVLNKNPGDQKIWLKPKLEEWCPIRTCKCPPEPEQRSGEQDIRQQKQD